MIKLEKVSKTFKNGTSPFKALSDINLEIKEGEFIAIMGPSGSGKTTLLNLIGGLDKIDSGKIFFQNKNIATFDDNDLSRHRHKNIGFIFQEFYLEKFLSVKDNILLPTFFDGSRKEKTTLAQKLIREVELSGREKSKVSELSGGQKQRVAIARALINEPKIIIADEPTGNLDIATGENILKLLASLHKNHKSTLIIATHDKKIAKAAERTIEIKDGKIQK